MSARNPLDKRILYGFIIDAVGFCIVVRYITASIDTAIAAGIIGGIMAVVGNYLLINYGRQEKRVALTFPITMGAWMLAVVWLHFDNLISLKENGRAAAAVVINEGRSEEPWDDNKMFRWIEYRYVINGKPYVSRNRSDAYKPDDTIMIRYDATDPGNSEPIDDR